MRGVGGLFDFKCPCHAHMCIAYLRCLVHEYVCERTVEPSSMVNRGDGGGVTDESLIGNSLEGRDAGLVQQVSGAASRDDDLVAQEGGERGHCEEVSGPILPSREV